MDRFTEKTIRIIREIPPGKVTTYGIIAAAAGNHCGARQVARILHTSSGKYQLPWHRVVNQKREISPQTSGGHLKQKMLLEDEGVVFDQRGKIDFSRYLWVVKIV